MRQQGIAFADDMVAEQCLQCFSTAPLCIAVRCAGDAEFDFHLRCAGAKAQLYFGWPVERRVADDLLRGRLSETKRLQAQNVAPGGLLHLRGKVCHHGTQHGCQFAGYTGRANNAAVAQCHLEAHSAADRVINNRGTLRQHRLLQVSGIELQITFSTPTL